jgi:hypothetical protein
VDRSRSMFAASGADFRKTKDKGLGGCEHILWMGGDGDLCSKQSCAVLSWEEPVDYLPATYHISKTRLDSLD